MRTYRLIDADTHVNEPPDLWSSRVADRFKDRAPRIESFDEGDAWVLEGVKDPINFGMNACAGMEPDQAKAWIRWSDIRPGGYDPKARIAEMDRDGCDAQVLYPTPRLSHSIIANTDTEFHLALVRAYNDWLAEYVSHDPERFAGVMLVPNRGVDAAVEEIRRVLKEPGMSGALIGCYPHGDLEIGDEDDAVWHELADRGVPASIHVSMVNEMPGAHKSKIVGDVRFYDAPSRILQLLWSGVFERVPDLKIVIAETDIGWLPYFKEQVDDRYNRLATGAGVSLPMQPSAMIEEHFYFTYITDHYGIRNRDAVGVDRILWSSDYPHAGADWPNSWRTIHADFSSVARQDRERIVAGNAQELYGFGSA